MTATAPGKVILFGEHSVVHGRPAIAVPVFSVKSTASITSEGPDLILKTPDLKEEAASLESASSKARPLYQTLLNAKDALKINKNFTIEVSSTVPFSAGMGSGASTAAAAIKEIAQHFKAKASLDELNALVYKTEVMHHGNPSGADNTVICYEKPVYFKRNLAEGPNLVQALDIKTPFEVVIANTGIAGNTKELVAGVKERMEKNRNEYEACFDAMAAIAQKAKALIETPSDYRELGPLMNQNHELLKRIGVSHPSLEALVVAARNAGALGAKLVGAGGGGNMIALTNGKNAEEIASALRKAGATNTIITRVG